jgi:enoyl-CoA hydratase
MEYMSGITLAIRDMPQPVIAAINGSAYGGGMCLPLGCDIRIAGESAVFRSAGITNGLAGTELGVSYLLPRLIGASRANEMILSGRVIDAHEAERSGLVSRVVPDDALMDEAITLA